MLFRKYHILLIRDGRPARNLYVRPVAPLVFLCLFLLLSLSLGHFLVHSQGKGDLQGRLDGIMETRLAQTDQLLSLSGDILNLQTELERIRDFDSRLHVMFGQESPLRNSLVSMGASGSEQFTRGDLFHLGPQALTRTLRQCQDELDVQLRLEEVRQQQLMLAIRNQSTRLHLMPSIWPVRGILTSSFGYRRDPITGAGSFHPALDISAPKGTPVFASASGRVVFADWDGAYGLVAHVRHTADLTTRYAHLSEIDVHIGQMVERGDVIGKVGSTGRTTGAHLHYEVRLRGDPVNPRNYILN